MMNIPDEAIEALIGSLGWRLVDGVGGAAREALGAAAPPIAAQAWNEGARATYEWILARQNNAQWAEPANPYEDQP